MKKLALLLLMAFTGMAAVAQPTYGWTAVSTYPTTAATSAQGRSVATDMQGNLYTTGYYNGTVNFDPAGSSAGLLTSVGGTDIFIQKLNADGTFAWVKGIGNANNSIAYGIALDASGNIYTTGYYVNTVNFDPAGGATGTLAGKGGTDIFVQKLDANGNFLWAKGIGGGSSDAGYGLAVDASGNVYVTGAFNGTGIDFDPGTGTATLSSAGVDDAFVLKLDASGNYVWAKSMGGTAADMGQGIAVDGNNNVYTTGYYNGTATFGTASLTSAGGADIFVQKLNADGSFAWAKSMGGTAADMGYGIVADGSGNIYTTGYYTTSGTFGATNLTGGGAEIFVQKLDTGGNVLWAKSMGGTGTDMSYAIALDVGSNVYITGSFTSTGADFDPGTGTASLSTAGSNDIFIEKLDANGTYVWAKKMGGAGADYGYGITIGSNGNIYTTGYFTSPSSTTPVNMNPVGGVDNKQGNTVAIYTQKLIGCSGFDLAITTESSTLMLSGTIPMEFMINCRNIAKVTPAATSGASGSTTAKVWVDAVQNPQYVKRHYEITPANNGAATVTLYFTQAEFDDYNNQAATPAKLLPTSSTDVAGKANLMIRKFNGSSSDPTTGAASTYTGTAATIDPDDANIVWNATASRWEVTFYVTGFSGFFVSTDQAFLPVTFGNIMATIKNGQLQVNFTTLTETDNDHFDIEISKDGKNFIKVQTLKSQYADGNSVNATNYTTNISLNNVAYAGFSVLLFAGLLLLLFYRKNRWFALTLIALTSAAITFTACQKKETMPQNQQDKVWIRIAQVDKDGKVEYSKIVGATIE